MEIHKALEHFEFKLKNVWKATEKDIEAYNSILEWKDLVESYNMNNNECLAKLWIHQLILLNNTRLYSAERSIQVIDEILSKSVYEWCENLRILTPLMRFNQVGKDKYPLDNETLLNRTKTIERNNAIVNEFEDELTKALKYEISEENIIKFVKSEITRIINTFEKL